MKFRTLARCAGIAATLVFLCLSVSSAAILYTVKSGDTLAGIAARYNTTVPKIIESNGDLNENSALKPGSNLMIPDSDEVAMPIKEANETHTLIIHNADNNAEVYSNARDSANVMIVNGSRIYVPKYQAPKTALWDKHRGKSSRGFFNPSIVRTAATFMGVPYVWGGATSSGFDCSGFVFRVFRMHGINVPRMADEQYYAGTPVSRTDIRPGDLVFFTTYTSGISHVGIYIGNNQFIHASSRGSVRINSLGEEFYTKRYMGACRY